MALLVLLRRLTSERAAWVLTLVFALGTAGWSTASQALWQQTYGQLAMIGWLYSIERFSSPNSGLRWHWMAGLFAASALAIRPTNVGVLPALFLVLAFQRAGLAHYLRVFAEPAVAAALIAAYNIFVFHRVTGGYTGKVDGLFFEGLIGVLLSPGRGLLVYTPIAIFALAAFLPRSPESLERHRPVAIAASVFSLSHIAFISMWPIWWGGYCWGPRLLTEILAPLTTLVAIGLPAIRGGGWRSAFAAAAIYGLLIQALGVYCYPKGQWDNSPVSVDKAPGRLWSWVDNPVIRTTRGGLALEPYLIIAAGAVGGWGAAAKKLQELGINPY